MPGTHGFKDATTQVAQIRAWWRRWPAANIGVGCGAARVVIVDLDAKNGAGGPAAWERLLERLGLRVEAVISGTPGGGRHLFFAAPVGTVIPNSSGRLAPGIDVRGSGGYVLLPPSRIGPGAHPERYAWQPGAGPGDQPPAPLPAELAAILVHWPARGPSCAAEPGAPAPTPLVVGGEWPAVYGRAAREGELARLRSAPEGSRNEQLNRSAFALGQLVGAGVLPRTEVAGELEQAALEIGLEPLETRRTIQSGLDAGTQQPRGLPEPRRPAPALLGVAQPGVGEAGRPATLPEAGISPPAGPGNRDHPGRPWDGPAGSPTEGGDAGSSAGGRDTGSSSAPAHPGRLALTDYGNAERLVACHGGDLHYCRPWGQWLVWDGWRWQVNDTGEVERRAKETVRAIYGEAARAVDDEARQVLARWAVRSEARAKIEAMICLAESEPGVPGRPAELDPDSWRLYVKKGTLDLRSGTVRPHDRADLITRLAPADYDPAAPAPAWQTLLERILDGDEALIVFVQRALGSALTGDTREQVLFILHGSGANGKSTLLEVVSGLMGDYALAIMTDTYMVCHGAGVPNDVARLRGARLVVAVEPEEGQRLAEGRVKQMTGGDRIAARFLHQEFFEFALGFKLFLATNHKPDVRGTDDAIWRRVRLVPLAVQIPETEQDKRLRDKLAAEAAGILARLVRGCLAWQREGLGLPLATGPRWTVWPPLWRIAAWSSRMPGRRCRLCTRRTGPGARPTGSRWWPSAPCACA